MTENVLNFNVDMDAECPECGEPGSVNGGLCMKCAAESLNGIIDRFVIDKILNAIRHMIYQNARKANDIWEKRKADKIKVLNVSVTLGKDSHGMPVVQIDFGYGEKIGASFFVQQKALPGME